MMDDSPEEMANAIAKNTFLITSAVCGLFVLAVVVFIL